MAPGRFTAWMGATVVLGMLASATVNYLVDPMQIFHRGSSSPEQMSRVEQFPNMRLYKPLHIARFKPNAIILGSSRTGGFAPADTNWHELDSYNASLPGMTVQEMDHFLRHAHAQRPLESLLLGIDYERIVSPQPMFRPGFVAARTMHPARELHSITFLKQRFLDYYTALFSTQFLRESLVAATGSGPGLRRYHMDGWWEPTSDQLSGQGGYIFAMGNRLKWGAQYPVDPEQNLAALKEMLDFCYRNGIRTSIVLTPAHVALIDLWLRFSTRDMWQQTHRRLLQINLGLAASYGAEPFEIWGFGHERQFVTEPIYRTRDVHKAWFADGIHPRPRLAQALVRTIYSTDPDNGMKLHPGNIDEYFRRIEQLRLEFIAANRDQMTTIYQRIGQDIPQW